MSARVGRPTWLLSEGEAAWSAGLFDGEGHVGLREVKGSPYLALTLKMTDEDVVRRFAETLRFGSIHEHRPRNPAWKMQFCWRGYGYERVAWLYEQWQPWLGSRRCARFEQVLAACGPGVPFVDGHGRSHDEQGRFVRRSA